MRDSSGKLVMKAVVETKADTILAFFHGLLELLDDHNLLQRGTLYNGLIKHLAQRVARDKVPSDI